MFDFIFRLTLVCGLAYIIATILDASPLPVYLSPTISTGNDIDRDNRFGQGFAPNPTGQAEFGSVTIDSSRLTEVCACDRDSGAMSIDVNWDRIANSEVSENRPGSFIVRAGELGAIGDPAEGGYNNMALAAASDPDGVAPEPIGYRLDTATRSLTFGGTSPWAAIYSPAGVSAYVGLAGGNLTLLTSTEQAVATISSVDIPPSAVPDAPNDGVSIPEPAVLPVLAVCLCILGWTQWKRSR